MDVWCRAMLGICSTLRGLGEDRCGRGIIEFCCGALSSVIVCPTSKPVFFPREGHACQIDTPSVLAVAAACLPWACDEGSPDCQLVIFAMEERRERTTQALAKCSTRCSLSASLVSKAETVGKGITQPLRERVAPAPLQPRHLVCHTIAGADDRHDPSHDTEHVATLPWEEAEALAWDYQVAQQELEATGTAAGEVAANIPGTGTLDSRLFIDPSALPLPQAPPPLSPLTPPPSGVGKQPSEQVEGMVVGKCPAATSPAWRRKVRPCVARLGISACSLPWVPARSRLW